MEKNKKISVSLFIVLLMCFILPFVMISCQGQEIVTLSGFELATGKDLSDITGDDERIPSNPLIIVTLLAIAASIGYCFKADKVNSLILAVISAASFIMLLIFKSNFTQRLMQETSGVLSIQYKFGFWAAVFISAVTAAFNGYTYYENRNMASGEAAVPVGRGTGTNADAPKFCTNCGMELVAGNLFCSECGKKIK